MSLELIKIKARDGSNPDQYDSTVYSEFYINKKDVVLIQKLPDAKVNHGQVKTEWQLTLKGAPDQLIIDDSEENSHFWRTVHSASLDREYVEKGIKKMNETLRVARDGFIFAYDHDSSYLEFGNLEDYKPPRDLIEKENPEWTEAQIEKACREEEAKFRQAYKDCTTTIDACWDSIQESEKHLNNAPATLNDVCKSLKDLAKTLNDCCNDFKCNESAILT